MFFCACDRPLPAVGARTSPQSPMNAATARPATTKSKEPGVGRAVGHVGDGRDADEFDEEVSSIDHRHEDLRPRCLPSSRSSGYGYQRYFQ